jgi:hypothetical protein
MVMYQKPMLKTISSRKRYHLLPCLALFYFVIGAHALHPHFHIHNSSEPDNSHRHSVSEVHHHPSIKGLVGSDHHSCLICDFFALNSAIEINISCFFIPSLPDQHEDNDCRMAVKLTHQTGFQIRGPPTIIPA